jgi:Aminoglycoside-2''-adenylyltransferase
MGRVVIGKSVHEILQLASDFFAKEDDVHQTMRRIAARLAQVGIDYAIVGGMAMTLHGYMRVTGDVDVLTTPEGLERIHQELVGRGYDRTTPETRRAIRDTQTGIDVKFITTGERPGESSPLLFPDPATVAVVREGLLVIALPKLIELKLASGLAAPHRLRDLADVQDLIVKLHLPRELGERLPPAVLSEFDRLWQLAQKRDPRFD